MLKRCIELKGMKDVKTIQSSKKRSIPRILTATYLELYMLDKEKERLDKENLLIGNKRKRVQKRLREIDAEMENLNKNFTQKEQKSSKSQNNKQVPKKWEYMPIKY